MVVHTWGNNEVNDEMIQQLKEIICKELFTHFEVPNVCDFKRTPVQWCVRSHCRISKSCDPLRKYVWTLHKH